MGHIQDMTREQRSDFLTHKYERTKESRRGDSFPYWNEKMHNQLFSNGYDIYEFLTGFDKEATSSITLAKDIVEVLRDNGNYARIICGYSQNRQRIRMFTIYYKTKNNA